MGTPDHLPAEAAGSDDAATQMLSKLAAMEVARKAEREQRQQAAKELADPRESVDGFLAWFHQQQTEVQQCCAQIQTASASSDRGDSGASQQLLLLQQQQQQQQQLDALLEQVGVLERAVAEASYFLPPYDLRQATTTAQELRQQLENAKAALAPKRKFAFSSKRVSRVKASEAAPTGTHAASTRPSSATQLDGAGASGAGASQAAFASAAGASGAAAPAGTAGAPDPCAAATAAAAPSVTAHDQELVRAGHGLMGLRDKEVVVQASQHAGADFVVIDCQRCSIWLLGPMPALRVQGLVDCKLYAGPIGGAAFVSGATSSTLMLAAQQVRIHSSSGSDFYLAVRSKPIIEHCNGLRFAPFMGMERTLPSCSGVSSAGNSSSHAASSSSGHAGDGRTAGGNSSCRDNGRQSSSDGIAVVADAVNGASATDTSTLWCQVEDFGWIKSTQSPHWSVLPLQDRVEPQAPTGQNSMNNL